MRVYVCGPMSHVEDFNYPAFVRASDELATSGHHPVSPAGPLVDGWKWADYMRRALTSMLTADAVALIDGWEHSTGARLECHVAHQLGIPTHPIDDYTNTKGTHHETV